MNNTPDYHHPPLSSPSSTDETTYSTFSTPYKRPYTPTPRWLCNSLPNHLTTNNTINNDSGPTDTDTSQWLNRQPV